MIDLAYGQVWASKYTKLVVMLVTERTAVILRHDDGRARVEGNDGLIHGNWRKDIPEFWYLLEAS